MKKLFICCTYYQLIIAIQLKLTLLKNDRVTMWFSDHSVNYDKIVVRLKKLKIFEDVEIIHMKHSRQCVKDIAEVFEYNFCKNNNTNVDFYDEIIFHNYDLLIYAIADIYKEKSHKVIWSRMEEGLFTYDTGLSTGNRVKLTRIIRKFTKRTDIVTEVKNYYCFFPKFKKNTYGRDMITVPPITEEIEKLKEILNYIFDYEPLEYNQKYIFFASSDDIENRSCGETELVLKIAEKVGKRNLIVKMHPRDARKIYEEYGISVMKNSYIPWEVIQLNWKDKNHTLLTVNSGAFLNITALLNQNTKGYFLYSYIKDKSDEFIKKANEISDILDELHDLNIASNIISLAEGDLQFK